MVGRIALTAILATHAAASWAGTTQLSIVGDPGAYIAQGQTFLFTPESYPFVVMPSGSGLIVNVGKPGVTAHDFTLALQPPFGQVLHVGDYENVPDVQTTQLAGFSISGDARDCDVESSQLRIDELEYSPGGDIASIAVSFTTHCDGGTAVTRGQLLVDAPVAVIPALDRRGLAIMVSLFCGLSLRRILSTGRTARSPTTWAISASSEPWSRAPQGEAPRIGSA